MPHYMPTSPTVSVLMATHDAAGSVRRAVESVQNQTMKNIELVVVDAGSTDDTPRTLERIAERDLRVSVVQADACGRREALDLALERARGTYVVVVDQDGWAEPALLERMVGLADGHSLELVIGGVSLVVSVNGGRQNELVAEAEGAVFSTQHDFRYAAWQLLGSGLLLPSCGKLFSRELLCRLGASFSAGRALRDHALVIDCLRDVERVGVVPGALYHVARELRTPQGANAVLGLYRVLEAERAALLDLYRHWGLDGDAASVEAVQNRFVELLAGCVEAACGPAGALSASEQRRVVGAMIEGDHVQLAASVAKPHDSGARSLLGPIRSHNVALACVQARLVSLLRGGRVGVGVDAFL